MTRLSRGLRESLETSGAIGHALTRGEVRESEVIAGLRPHIPERFEVASGEVINAEGQRSLQQDVIIADKLIGTPFLATGGIGVFPIEIVYGVLQVKSSISPSEIAEAVENIRSVKTLIPDGSRMARPIGPMPMATSTIGKPYGGIVAFSASSDLVKLGQAFIDANAAIPASENRCDALVVIDRALIAWLDNNKQFLVPSALNARSLAVAEGPDALLQFYLTMRQMLSSYAPPDFHLHTYAQGSSLTPVGTWTLGPPEGAESPAAPSAPENSTPATEPDPPT